MRHASCRFLFSEEIKGFCFSALRDYHTSAYANSPTAPTMLVILASRVMQTSSTTCFLQTISTSTEDKN
jgi:hypothetical protein